MLHIRDAWAREGVGMPRKVHSGQPLGSAGQERRLRCMCLLQEWWDRNYALLL